MPSGKYERSEAQKEQMRRNLAVARKIPRSKKARENLSKAKTGKKIHTDESKKKIGAGAKKNWQDPEYKEKVTNIKDRDQWRKNTSGGMKKMISNLSEEEKQERIRAWREAGIVARREKRLRTETKIERAVRESLDRLDILYEQEYPIDQIHVDFYLIEYNVVIEADGKYWHSLEHIQESDKRRDMFLKNRGIKVIRLGEDDLMENEDLVDELIMNAIIEVRNGENNE